MFRVNRIYAGQASDFLADVLHLRMRAPGFELPVDAAVSGGVWSGRGCRWFGVAGNATDRQLQNLFVDGLHPDAERIYSDYLQAASLPVGWTPAQRARASAATVRAAARSVQLGARWPVFTGGNPWRAAMYRAYSKHNLARGLAKGARLSAEDRATLQIEVGRQEFERIHNQPPTDDELRRFLRTYRRPAQGAVSGYELLFSSDSSGSSEPGSLRGTHSHAVSATLELIEREASWTRLGGSDRVRSVPVDGLVMVTFPAQNESDEIYSRVLLSCKVRTEDTRWVALDGRRLYAAVPDIAFEFDRHLATARGRHEA